MKIMDRRDFFKNIMTQSLELITPGHHGEQLSEKELFMEAMRFGIDPATQSLTELRRTVNKRTKEDTNSG